MPPVSESPARSAGVVARALHRAVGLRRALRGPLRASWSHEMETFSTLLRLYAGQSHRLPVAVQRWFSRRIRNGSALAATTEIERFKVAGCPAAFFRRADSDPTRVLYYLHGGGYVIGSFETTHFDLLCRLCAASGATVFALDYRLAPEHPYPAAIDDAVAAYRWLLGRGFAPAQLVVGGESAGGGLTLATLQTLRAAGDPLPAAALALSPWVDLAGSSASIRTSRRYDYLQVGTLTACRRAYRGPRGDCRDPLVSPLHADLRGLPPLLVHVGGAEAFHDEAVQLAHTARAAGVEVDLDVWRDMIHAWHVFAAHVPEGQHAIDHAGAWVRARTASQRGATAAR